MGLVETLMKHWVLNRIRFELLVPVAVPVLLVCGFVIYSGITAGAYGDDRKAAGELRLRGSVIAAITDNGTVDEIIFDVSNYGTKPVELPPGKIIIEYQDSTQSITIPEDNYQVAPKGNANDDYLADAGEIYEVKLFGLGEQLGGILGPDADFAIQITPLAGEVFRLERSTPRVLNSFTDLG